MKKVERLGVTNVLEKEIVFYGSWEEPLFLGKDVAEWIEHTNPSKLISNVNNDEKILAICELTNSYSTSSTARDTQQMIFITEDGLYETLMQSRKPIAKQLRKQIKSYLKQIRKTGGTIEEGREEEFIDKYFPSFSDEVKLSMVQDLLKTNKENKPKVDYYNDTLKPSNLKTTTDVAKDMGMSAQKLNKLLHEKEVIYPKKANGKTKGWYLYAKYEHLVPEYADFHITKYGQSLKWTEKGRKYILELLQTD